MGAIQLGRNCTINSDDISSVTINENTSQTTLTVRMKNGDSHIVKHWPYGYDELNVYDLQRTITAALG